MLITILLIVIIVIQLVHIIIGRGDYWISNHNQQRILTYLEELSNKQRGN